MPKPTYWPDLGADEVMRCRRTGREVQLLDVTIGSDSWSCDGLWSDGTYAGSFMWYDLEPIPDDEQN
ncbi:MAG: hypothetical protein F4Z53_01090 [Acidimicrobiales bacterium]|nr:hypothetical protein [Acidimicrobiaceae bacterium]MXX41630.1 hypothetical protein [Acidimicrobiales bacterium]MYD33334.1 hypothetical protein [Acidimicrobiales bacterium]MYI09512.1 hypothetical protein [Acidimicrobiales bacterium]